MSALNDPNDANYVAPWKDNKPLALLYQRRQLNNDLANTLTRMVVAGERRGDKAHAQALNHELTCVLRKLELWRKNAPETYDKLTRI
jgi:hypothetical protein